MHWLSLLVLAAPPADAPPWSKEEAPHLKNVRQITHDFVRAGESYYSPDARHIVFQAEEKDSGNPFYQIFTMDLDRKSFRRISPGVGKTTCAYFSPDGKKLIFASSHLDPDAKKHYAQEYKERDDEQKSGKRRRYKWDFDAHMDIFEVDADGSGKIRRLTGARGYDAEGSYSPDGKHIVFCSNRSGAKNLELYIMDADGKNVRQLTNAPNCYNGGPFFAPDGKRVIFRSDRKKADHLQLYVIDVDGKDERALTDNLDWVQWGPYWYRDAKHIIYAGADHTKLPPNYDLYWMNVETGKKVRITHYPGADVLPVFSPDGTKLMWTSTRNQARASQIYIGDFAPPKTD